ncbi:ion transporter, partial [Gulosibacter macacae]
ADPSYTLNCEEPVNPAQSCGLVILTSMDAEGSWSPNPRATGWRRRLGEFVLSSPVQSFVLAVIVLNAVTLGLETSPAVMSVAGPFLHLLDTIALTIFVIEILLKLLALDGRFFRDGWNIFDFLVVVISLIPAAGPFAVLRSLRVLRVLRLVNRLPQLRRIASSIIKAIPGIGAIAALMAIVFYVGAVMATVLFGNSFPQWFGSIPASLYSLFQVMTLESWSMGIVRPVMEVYPEAWMFFVPFILVSAFVMLNLFIAVIIDAMSNLEGSTKGTVAEPAPVRTAPVPTAGSIFAAERELTELRAEVTETRREIVAIRALLEGRATGSN